MGYFMGGLAGDIDLSFEEIGEFDYDLVS